MEINDIIKNSTEPEVVKAVFDELKKYGDDNKKSYEELRRNYEELKSASVSDAVSESKFKKLSEDIITRQEAIDQNIQKSSAEMTKRVDDLEVAFKRPGMHGSASSEDEAKEAKSFAQSIAAARGQGARIDTAVNVDELKEYKRVNEKFLRMGDKHFNDLERKTMLVASDPDGGYVVTPALASKVITRQFESDPLRALASVETISTGAIEWLVDYDQATVAWEEETVATPADTETAQLQKKRIAVFPLAARPCATQTLIEDASINIESWLAMKAADRFSRFEAAAFVTGDGIGKPRGFLDYDDYATAGTDQYGRVEQIHMGNASALTADGFARVKYALVEQYLNRGTWLMNRSTVLAAMLLKNGAGDYIWKPGLASDAQSTILGLPVRMSTTMPAVAASALSIALADWKEAYMIVDRIGITVQRDPFTRKPFIEFYFRKRVGGDVVNFQAIKIGTIEA
jgi:HK97 family phage major capsid protein